MIYFLSDAHIGSLAMPYDVYEHQRRVIHMLNTFKKDAIAIFLVGDIFDFWYEYKWRDKSKKQYSALMQCLRHLVKRGISVHFLPGNHDLWTFGGLHKLTGMHVHTRPAKMELNGKKVYIAHGDGLIPSGMEKIPQIKRFIRLSKFFHNPVAQKAFQFMPPKWGNAIGYNWAKRSRMKELAKPCPYKGEDREELVLYSKEYEADPRHHHHDYYIYGHRHIALDLPITSDSRVIILGDCFQQYTYARMDEKGEVTLNHFDLWNEEPNN